MLIAEAARKADVRQLQFPAGIPARSFSKRELEHRSFATGQASFTAEGERKECTRSRTDLAIAGALFVTLNGHIRTIPGTREGNMDLAERRAPGPSETGCRRKAPSNLPGQPFSAILHAYGRFQAPSLRTTTAEGRAKNRRVKSFLSGKE